MQFMPSTWLRWGLDADGDGVASPWSAADAIYAAARYLAAAGGATDISRAIFAYNHAQWYVDEVLQLAKVFGTAGAQATFGIDQLGQRLDEARVGVVEINRALVQAVRLQRALERRANRLQAKVEKAELLSDRLEAQKHATQAGVRADAAAAKVAKLRGRLQRAETALSTARDRAQPAGFVAGAQPLTDAPSYDSNYVFPVGGGPSVVSVSHHHHDYPAADIAAPEGSPVYALSDGIVLSAWQLPDARCGIGLTLRTSDGQSWTYCHLAYLAPSVQRGTAVSAGDAVGLVGETGHATGPHLHLQLNPPTSYPQLQPWFERFAGTAFRWQDAPTPEPADGPTPAPTAAPRQTDVFAVAGADSSAETASVVRFSR
jgi:murein DD-endopeptidase MepM/ murein hydrolase activator NlpD